MGDKFQAVIVGANDANARANDVLAECVADDLGVEIVEAGIGLVQKKHGRLLDQRAGDSGALLLTTGKKGRAAIGKIAKAKQGEPALGAFESVFLGKARERAGHLEITRNRGEREEI